MTTILGLIGGGDRDQIIMRTSLAAAVPLSAHLDFLHVHVTPGVAAKYSRADYAIGPAIRNALSELDTKANTFSKVAADHVRNFCSQANIEFSDIPASGKNVTASFREETDTTIERLTFHARQSDLVVIGRARQTQGLSPHTLEHLIRNCGRPVLVATGAAPQSLTGTVMVCWKNSENVARAVAAAMPYLTSAKRVVVTIVEARGKGDIAAVHGLEQQLASNGIPTDVQVIPASKGGISSALLTAANECKADLVVMGAYGHSQLRELIFGSCTEAVIRNADKPILLMH